MIMLLSTTGTSARFSRSVGRAMLAGAEAVRTLLKRRRTYGSLSALDDRICTGRCCSASPCTA
jgi:hypothetical protein